MLAVQLSLFHCPQGSLLQWTVPSGPTHITRYQGAAASGVHHMNDQKNHRYVHPNRKIHITSILLPSHTDFDFGFIPSACMIAVEFHLLHSQPMDLLRPWHLRPLGTDCHGANSHFAHHAATAKAWSIQKPPAKGHLPSLSKEQECRLKGKPGCLAFLAD